MLRNSVPILFLLVFLPAVNLTFYISNLSSVINSHNYGIFYPKRVIACIFKQDLEGIKNETKRFIINSKIETGEIVNILYKAKY